jgi:hypothetical protein
MTFSTSPQTSSLVICGRSPLLQLTVLKTFSDMVFDYNKMIDNPFIKNLVIREFMDRFSFPTGKQTIISLARIIKDIQRFYKKKDLIIGDWPILYESAVTYMSSFATSTLRMLLCIVHLVKIFIPKNSLTSRTQLKTVTLFQRSTPSRPDHVLNELGISLNSRKNRLRIRPCWEQLSRTT